MPFELMHIERIWQKLDYRKFSTKSSMFFLEKTDPS
jgi:hypothetical protein